MMRFIRAPANTGPRIPSLTIGAMGLDMLQPVNMAASRAFHGPPLPAMTGRRAGGAPTVSRNSFYNKMLLQPGALARQLLST